MKLLVLRYLGMSQSTQTNEALHTTSVKIDGMSCGACISHITNVLNGLSGVVNIHVDLKRREAVIGHQAVWTGEHGLIAALAGAGYQARVSDTRIREGRMREPIELPRISGCCCITG